MIQLRDYQQRSIDDIWVWFRENKEGHPLACLPTGAGKSLICGGLTKEAISFPSVSQTRVLIVTHSKELVEQNYEKFVAMSPETDTGIYAAGLGRKELHNQVVFASVQSIARVRDVGFFNLLIIDEAHRVPEDGDGQYLSLIEQLQVYNPGIRVIGLTATPFRLDSGYLHKGAGLFTDIATEVTIPELIARGYLSRMVPRKSATTVSMKGVPKVAGEYNQRQAAARMMGHSETAINDVIEVASDRKSWLIFCVTVAHAEQVAGILREKGISSAVVSGKTPSIERDLLIQEFRAGRIRALVNCEVLTTGFDAPRTDLVVLLRPTNSASLYIQMAGRGMRVAEGKENCMMLDYAGNIQRHGCLDDPQIQERAASDGTGEAPLKTCLRCETICPLGLTECPECGYQFRSPDDEPVLDQQASDLALLKKDKAKQAPVIKRYTVTSVSYKKHQKPGKPPTLRVNYYGHEEDATGFDRIFSKQICMEWVSVEGNGYAREKAFDWWMRWCQPPFYTSVDVCLKRLQEGEGRRPIGLVVDETEKYPKIVEYIVE